MYIAQAFDKVWHVGLLHKIKYSLPYHFYIILKSYLDDRKFIVKYGDSLTKKNWSWSTAGECSRPLLYLLFTADLPVVPNTMVATFADDTAILASNKDPVIASRNLQIALDKIQLWLKTQLEHKIVHL